MAMPHPWRLEGYVNMDAEELDAGIWGVDAEGPNFRDGGSKLGTESQLLDRTFGE